MPRSLTATKSFEFYEPQYFKYSTTYRSWVKLFIADAHALTILEGFEGTRARFWNNHPIRWMQLVGTVVGVVVKATFAEITIDDGSGLCMNLYIKNEAARSLNVDFEENYCEADVGHLLKVKGTLTNDHKGELQLVVDKIQILDDPAMEIKAWRERVHYRETILDKPWRLDLAAMANPGGESITESKTRSAKPTSHEANLRAQLKEDERGSRPIDLAELDCSQHTQRNFKLVLLRYLAEHNTRGFSISELRTHKDVEQATVLVAREAMRRHGCAAGIDLSDVPEYRVDSRQKYRTLNACLAELVRDGSILSINAAKGMFCTVGRWNLGSLMQDILNGRVDGEAEPVMSVREVWQAVRSSGQGYERVSKQMVLKMAEQLGLGHMLS